MKLCEESGNELCDNALALPQPPPPISRATSSRSILHELQSSYGHGWEILVILKEEEQTFRFIAVAEEKGGH